MAQVVRRGSRPRVGVALSSGGAAGMAHVGVLEVLAEAGIPIHCVVGTSAGAMVGAAYAANHLPEFRDLMSTLTLRRVFWLFTPTWPRVGLMEGRRPLELIRPYVGDRIESLPRAYAAIATDLGSGEEVVIRSGSVLAAIRASAAVPGVVTPVRWHGRLLADGGLVNPLPVDVARHLGADVVIAVSVLRLPENPLPNERENGGQSWAAQWLSRVFTRGGAEAGQPLADSGTEETAPATVEEELGLIEVITRAAGLVQARLAANQLRTHPPDCLISVHQHHIGLFDFHRSAEVIEAGRVAARRALPAIRDAIAPSGSLSGRLSRWRSQLRPVTGHRAIRATGLPRTRRTAQRGAAAVSPGRVSFRGASGSWPRGRQERSAA